MKQLLKDILNLITSLNQMDLLLYFAVLILIILVVSLIYIIKTGDEEIVIEEEDENRTKLYNKEEEDIKDIITNIENTAPPIVEFTEYEREQEEKAIISYDELLERSKKGTLSFATEEVANNEISIKKINLDKMTNNSKIEEKQNTNSLFNYEKEEDFLKALKNLNELLN